MSDVVPDKLPAQLDFSDVHLDPTELVLDEALEAEGRRRYYDSVMSKIDLDEKRFDAH